MKDNNKKNLLIFIMLISIIAVLFIGVVYQFIVIKSLQSQISNLESFFKIFLKY